MAVVKYTNLTDMDTIYLLVNSTKIYYDVINGKSNYLVDLHWCSMFQADQWSKKRIRMIYQRINDIRKKYNLFSVKTGASLEECWEGIPPQKLHVL